MSRRQTIFLTSSPAGYFTDPVKRETLDDRNQFVENLKRVWKAGSRCLIISASPDSFERNDKMAEELGGLFAATGFEFCAFDVWDDRTKDFSLKALNAYDVIILGGGHVPTQNQFFIRIGLRETIRDFEGIIIGISAGSMNSADVVYAQPELEGEASDPDYRRFLVGLNLTKAMILPHYQVTKGTSLDGKLLFEEITYGDSRGREFLVFPDGSYLLSEDGKETIWGEAYTIADGRMRRIRENK